MESQIRRIGINVISLIEFLKKEKIYGSGKINFIRIKLLSKGFYSLGQVPFNFQKFSYSDFISDFENILNCLILTIHTGDYSGIK